MSKHDVSVEALAMVGADEKNCGECTMLNPIDAKECHMCLTKFQD